MLEGIPCLQLFGCMKEKRSRDDNVSAAGIAEPGVSRGSHNVR